MADVASKYAVKVPISEGVTETQVLADAWLSADNIKNVRVTFNAPKEIVQKEGSRPTFAGSGRTAYGRGYCVYDDGTKLDGFHISGCVIQHRRKASSNYGVTSVYVGIPAAVWDTVYASATRTVTTIPAVTDFKDGYYWMYAKLTHTTQCFIVNDKGSGYPVDVKSLLEIFDSNISARIKAIVGISSPIPTPGQPAPKPPSISVSLRAIYPDDTTSVDATGIAGNDNEVLGDTSVVVASADFIARAMQKLQLAQTDAE